MHTAKEWADADPNVAHYIAGASGSASIVCGPPGVSKSQGHLQLAKASNRKAIILIGSIRAPEDFGGIPFLSEDRQYFLSAPPDWAYMLKEPGHLLLIDEFTTVPPSVRAALLSLITERRLGSIEIHRDNWIFAACNPVEMAPSASPLEKAMANRFAHFKWKWNWLTFESGIKTADDKFPNAFVPNLNVDFSAEKVHWGHLVASYLSKNSSERISIPTDDDQMAFPTPRSWHYLRNAMALADAVGAPVTVKRDLAKGFIGDVSGVQFIEWVGQLDLCDPEEVLKNFDAWKYESKRVDKTTALLTAIKMAVETNFTPERFTTAVRFFVERVAAANRELVVAYLRPLLFLAQKQGLPAEVIPYLEAFGNSISK